MSIRKRRNSAVGTIGFSMGSSECPRRSSGARAGALLEEDGERMVTFYAFPQEHWKHLRTTNVVEAPFARVRLRTNAAKRYQKVENATAVIWKVLAVGEKRFRELGGCDRVGGGGGG